MLRSSPGCLLSVLVALVGGGGAAFDVLPVMPSSWRGGIAELLPVSLTFPVETEAAFSFIIGLPERELLPAGDEAS